MASDKILCSSEDRRPVQLPFPASVVFVWNKSVRFVCFLLFMKPSQNVYFSDFLWNRSCPWLNCNKVLSSGHLWCHWYLASSLGRLWTGQEYTNPITDPGCWSGRQNHRTLKECWLKTARIWKTRWEFRLNATIAPPPSACTRAPLDQKENLIYKSSYSALKGFCWRKQGEMETHWKQCKISFLWMCAQVAGMVSTREEKKSKNSEFWMVLGFL